MWKYIVLKATEVIQTLERKTPTSRHRQKTSATAPHFDFWTWQSLQTGWLTQSSVSSVYIKIQEQEEDGGAFNSNCFYN